MFRMQPGSEKGSGLVIVMIMAIVATGMIAAMIILSQRAAEQHEEQLVYKESIDIAEAALNQTLEDIRTYMNANNSGWVEASLDTGSADTRTVTGTINNVPYVVRVRSAYLAHQAGTSTDYLMDVSAERLDPNGDDYDVYELISVSGEINANGLPVGVGKNDYRSGVRTVIRIGRNRPNQVDAPLYIENDPSPKFSGNAFSLSGEDHDMNATVESVSLVMPYDGTCSFTFKGSTAGLTSGFYYIDPDTGEEKCVFANNQRTEQNETVNQVFTKGQALNFFARTQGSAWGIGDYDHYTEEGDPYSGKPWCKKFVLNEDDEAYLQDGTTCEIQMRDGDPNIYEKGTYNIVHPLEVDINSDLSAYSYKVQGKDVVKIRYGIEDLPGKYYRNGNWNTPDWDYDDIVVDVLVQEENGGGNNTATETPWWEMPEQDALTGEPGKPAIAQKPIEVDQTTGLYVNKDGYLMNEDGELVDADGHKLNNNDSPVLATAPTEWDQDTCWDAMGVDNNQIDQIRCDGIDADGNHTGFDMDAVEAGTASIAERDISYGQDAYTDSHLDLRKLAADIVGGTADALPTDASQLNADVNMYDKIGNGNNHNDIGAKDDMKVTYINGDAGTLAGQIEGGGVLVINGDAHISGKWAFAGIVIVLGDLKISGGGNGLHMLGSIMVEGNVEITGNADIWWSQNAVANAMSLIVLPPEYENERKSWRRLDKGDVDQLGF